MTGIPRPLYWRLLATLIIGSVSLWAAVIIYASHRATTERDRLCLVLYALINRSGVNIGKKGFPGYAYYRAHPKELKTAKSQNHSFLDALPCAPRPTPPPLRNERK